MTGTVAPTRWAPRDCCVGCCSQAFPAHPRSPKEAAASSGITCKSQNSNVPSMCFRLRKENACKSLAAFPLSSLARHQKCSWKQLQPQWRYSGWFRHIKATPWDGGSWLFGSWGPMCSPTTHRYTHTQGGASGVLCVPPTTQVHMHSQEYTGENVHKVTFYSLCMPSSHTLFCPKEWVKDAWPTMCGQVGAQSWGWD